MPYGWFFFTCLVRPIDRTEQLGVDEMNFPLVRQEICSWYRMHAHYRSRNSLVLQDCGVVYCIDIERVYSAGNPRNY